MSYANTHNETTHKQGKFSPAYMLSLAHLIPEVTKRLFKVRKNFFPKEVQKEFKVWRLLINIGIG